jgi:multiple sugar transport system permease protein
MGPELERMAGPPFARTFFIAPAVILILIFAIFPTFYVDRLRLEPCPLLSRRACRFRFVWFDNFHRPIHWQRADSFPWPPLRMSVLGWIFALAIDRPIAWWWLYRSFRSGSLMDLHSGRIISAAMFIFIAYILGATLLSGNPWGTLLTTLFYVFVGCTVQFVIGLGLAFLCSQPICRQESFFRVLFFIPLMITPLGVGYAFKMVLDITKGPLQPLWDGIGLQNWAWATDPWAARIFIIVGDSWQWIPFIFVVLLAALENVPRDHVEAAQVDGASSSWQIFREIVWPQIIPVA